MTLYQSMWSPWTRLIDAIVMRRRRASVSIAAGACFLLSASIPADASEEMGLVYVVKSDPSTPSTVFAGAERGVFKSLDAGATWTATGLTEATTGLAIALVTPTTVYAGTGSGLRQSGDGGTS